MRIAFISYEYPPDTADGGIATYVHQAAAMLQQRGHEVEVFAGSRTRTESQGENGITVHRFLCPQHENFSPMAGEAFAARHAVAPFDVLEGPDFAADAEDAVRRVPAIPLVLKLHTPSIVLLRLNYRERTLGKRLRLALKTLRRGRIPLWGYHPGIESHYRHVARANERERAHALEADEIASPSQSLGQILVREWRLDSRRVTTVPYPYNPSPKLLRIPPETETSVVTFLGRLEVRKGVLDLAGAIPMVVRRHPQIRFRFVGATDDSPVPGLDMLTYLQRELKPFENSVEFCGAVPPTQIPEILAATDVCVFPSAWENFPCVCLEAMAAARGIVGSAAGGMSEMLEDGRSGFVVPPHSPSRLARAINALFDDVPRRMEMGRQARARLIEHYNVRRVGDLQEASYARAIAHRRAAGTRQFH